MLNAYLAAQGINLVDLITHSETAAAYKNNHQLKMGLAENHREKRDNIFDPVFDNLVGCVQDLKSHYRGETHMLGEWGITVNSNRVVYPADFVLRKMLVVNFYTHHLDEDSSPLNHYLERKAIDPDAEITKAEAAADEHNQMMLTRGEAEDDREDFDNLWKPIMSTIRGIGQRLKNHYDDNPQELIRWGFTIDQSSQAPRTRVTTLLLGQHITIGSVKIGSLFTNLGTTDLHVHKGKGTTGEYTLVAPGAKLGMQKGYSTITVANPNLLETGKFSVEITSTLSQ